MSEEGIFFSLCNMCACFSNLPRMSVTRDCALLRTESCFIRFTHCSTRSVQLMGCCTSWLLSTSSMSLCIAPKRSLQFWKCLCQIRDNSSVINYSPVQVDSICVQTGVHWGGVKHTHLHSSPRLSSKMLLHKISSAVTSIRVTVNVFLILSDKHLCTLQSSKKMPSKEESVEIHNANVCNQKEQRTNA